jgi:hypothetical protein
MPIIFRPKGNFPPPTTQNEWKQWAESKLESVPLDWDENRMELSQVPGAQE